MALPQIELPVGRLTFDAVVDGPVDGAPVLLLHGFPESSRTWAAVQPALADAGYRVVAPDLRGYSPRARPTEPEAYSMKTLMGDVTDMADVLGWDTFHLVGHDWGGAVAWQTAGHRPERLMTLSVISTPHPVAFEAAKKAGPSADGEDQSEKSGYMHLFREEGTEDLLLADDGAGFRLGMAAAGLDPASIDHYATRLATPEAMIGALNWYRGADPADSYGLGPITTPTLYIWSTDDIALGRVAAEGTAAQVDGPYTFVVLDGVSHWIPEQASEAVVEHLLAHFGAA